MDTLMLRFTDYAAAFRVLDIIGLVFLLLIVSETVWDVATGRRRAIGQTVANFAIGIGNALLERTLVGAVFVIGLFMAEPFQLFDLPLTWWSWALALLAADFTYYWMHRLEHEIRFLWGIHSVHHSSPEFNLTTSLRLAWVEPLIEWLFFVPMILIGFDPVQTIVAVAIVVAYQTWIHTEKIGKLGWLDRVFNTPSVHRVHHAANRKYLDKNYGGILIIWDRLFGTYQADEGGIIYGVSPKVASNNPVMINAHEFGRMARDVANAKNLSEAAHYMLDRPGWKPVKQPPE